MNTENTTMTNDCKTCPVSTGTHKPAEAVHQIDEPQGEAMRLADECDESATHWVHEIDTRFKAAKMLRAQQARIAELEQRLEIDPRHRYDGISARDATIEAQDERIEELESQLEAIGAGGVEPLRKPVVQSELIQAIQRAGFQLLKTPNGYELIKLGQAYAQSAHPAEGVPVQAVELDVDDLIDRLLDAQQDLNLAANVHMDQSIESASTLLDEVEIALRTLAATQPAAQGMEQDAARWRMVALISKEVMIHPDKRTAADAVSAYMHAVHSGLDIQGAIDAALAAQAKQGGAA